VFGGIDHLEIRVAFHDLSHHVPHDETIVDDQNALARSRIRDWSYLLRHVDAFLSRVAGRFSSLPSDHMTPSEASRRPAECKKQRVMSGCRYEAAQFSHPDDLAVVPPAARSVPRSRSAARCRT